MCGRCSGIPAGAASGCRVPGEARRSSVQTSLSVNLQVPAWLPPGGAVPAHILEGSFDARSVKPHFRFEDVHTSLCVGVFVELGVPSSNHNLYRVIQWKEKEKDNPRINV